MVNNFGTPLPTPVAGLTHLSPTPAQLAALSPEALTALGILSSRAKSIIAIARAIIEDNLQLHPFADVETAIAQLKALPGIGDWTAQYIAMRVLAYPDAFPHSDLCLRRVLGVDKPAQVLRMAEAWRPWRAYAAMCLWKSSEKVQETA